jgi:hypothetical protein
MAPGFGTGLEVNPEEQAPGFKPRVLIFFFTCGVKFQSISSGPAGARDLGPVKARTWIKRKDENSPKGKMYFHPSITTYMYFLYV